MNSKKRMTAALIMAAAVSFGLAQAPQAKADLATTLAISLAKKMVSSSMQDKELKYSKKCVAGYRSGSSLCKIRQSDLDAWKGAPHRLIHVHPLFAGNQALKEVHWTGEGKEMIETWKFDKIGNIPCTTVFYLHQAKVTAVYMTPPDHGWHFCFTSVEFRPRDMLRGGVLWEPGG